MTVLPEESDGRRSAAGRRSRRRSARRDDDEGRKEGDRRAEAPVWAEMGDGTSHFRPLQDSILHRRFSFALLGLVGPTPLESLFPDSTLLQFS